jgi:hypothetical protein
MVPPVRSRRCLRHKAKTSGDNGVVNKITWQRAGGVTEPGRYMFTFGWLTVTSDDLKIWSQFPDASFTLVEMPAQTNGQVDENEAGEQVEAEEFHLGTFELPPPRSYS